jgi:site-specific DNA-methyltransferase (adenine-specific)
LIYLDPPFNSKADYNVLFKEKSGEESTAQIQAFTDFWHWDAQATKAFNYLVHDAPNEAVGKLVLALNTFLGRTDMLAYVVMMGERLLQLHRVLKSTGSIFLHCDTTASHYLKLLMDSIFGVRNFRNEITWKRQTSHSDAKRFGKISDRILFYSKTNDYKFNRYGIPFKDTYMSSKFKTDKDGRKFTIGDLNPPGGRGPIYEFHGITRPWRYTKEKMMLLEKQGRVFTEWKVPRIKRYLDELEAKRGGAAVHELWDDISPINSQAKERLGFQTQKPIALLERIIKSCSDDGDLVLDPFCGCGTAIVAAEKLRRQWIGIDVTMLAINLVKRRLNDMFTDLKIRIDGEPTDMQSALDFANRDRYEFQHWALLRIGARPVGSTVSDPNKVKKGADEGYDGWLRFQDGYEGNVERILIQVKSGHVGVVDIRHFRDVINTKGAAMGVFITLQEPTRDMIEGGKDDRSLRFKKFENRIS